LNKEKNEYRQLQAKIIIRTVLLALGSVIATIAIYNIFLADRFANAVVGFMNHFIYHDYNAAMSAYQQVFRNHMDLYILAAILIIFLIAMWIYVRGFTRYFNEINRGIDALIEENTGEILLSPELNATARKINQIKHTLEQRKRTAESEEQRKNDLVFYLAHDLKTPLTSVIGYLTLLRDEKQISEALREKYLSISLEKAERLEDLINEFFEITRFNLTHITLAYSRVNLTRLLEQLIFEFQPMLMEKNLTCTLEALPDLMIRCDTDKMQRVFDNLLRNAVNYSSEGSIITISALAADEKLKITFINSGNTIPPEKLNRIFEQFYRLDTARTSKNGGAGLGLSIAKEIVELHGGTIIAESRNEVTSFQVTLPLS
jgi:two-component system sensor histidine kinase VanS